MKLPCEMMEDLLPLYAEDMATNATRAAVEEHLKDCEACRKRLETIRKEPMRHAETIPLEKVRAELRLRRLLAVVAAVCATMTLLLTVFAWNSKSIYVPYVKENVSVVTWEDGRTQVLLRGATGVESWGTMGDDEDSVIYLAPWRNWNSNQTAETYVTIDMYDKVWFVDVPNGGELTLLQGLRSEEDGDGGQMMPRLALGYYLIIAGIATALLMVGGFLFRHDRAGRIMRRLATLSGCYLAAHGLVMGFTTVTPNLTRDLLFIVPVALSLWGLATTGEQLLRQRWHDRG